jgi:SAM-dependent methyltransferase
LSVEKQSGIDERNRAFWDELCGSVLAQSLGITEITPESLARFDEAYMDHYPYLARYLDDLAVEDRRVLEIGLGFGTVGQILAARGAHYTGADIAAGPVAMMRDRLRWVGLTDKSEAVQASALELPWEEGTFDVVVSIGCLHHTGDLPQAVSEVFRVLVPGGTAFVMLYNAHSGNSSSCGASGCGPSGPAAAPPSACAGCTTRTRPASPRRTPTSSRGVAFGSCSARSRMSGSRARTSTH